MVHQRDALEFRTPEYYCDETKQKTDKLTDSFK